MKKLLLLFAALLPCFLAYSQEADDTGSYVDVQIIPRFEFNPYFTPGGELFPTTFHLPSATTGSKPLQAL